jgi:DNA repair exonuclease SbcCD ATPase subunit
MTRKPKPAARDRVAELEDKLKLAEDRIKDLRRELSEAEELVSDMREQVEDADSLIDSWIEAFDMTQGENGKWTFAPWVDQCIGFRDAYFELRTKWNRHVTLFNNTVVRRNVGRPLAASEAQVATVRKLSKAGKSLRAIMEETSLSFQTVRTIVDQANGVDRTTMKHLERIDPDRKEETLWRAHSRVRKALPKRITETLERGRELVKAAKGLK